VKASQPALVAQFVDGYSPDRVSSAQAVGGPLIDSIKALRANVARQHPQKRLAKAEFEKMGTRGRHEGSADALAPLFGVHIESKQLSVVGHIRVARRRGGSKALDRPLFICNDGPRLQGVEGGEIVPLRSIFGPKLVEVVIRKERSVGNLPGADVHAGYGNCILGFGSPDQHVHSMAWELRFLDHEPIEGRCILSSSATKKNSAPASDV